MNEAIAPSFLLTAFCHGTCLLIAVWLLISTRVVRSLAAQEAAWRLALIVPLFSAALQICGLRTVAQLQWNIASTPVPATVLQRHPLPSNRSPATQLRYELARPATDMSTDATVLEPVAADDTQLRARLITLGCWLWALAVAFNTARIVSLTRRSWRRARGLPAITHARLLEVARHVASRTDIDLPGLKWDDGLTGPATLLGRIVCIPSWVLERLAGQQLEALLAHEFAHVRRKDPAWQMLWAWLAVVSPSPFTHLVRKRLRELAELQCDACAAQQCSGMALAQSLLICAERTQHAASEPAFAVAMLGNRSTFVIRVQRLLRTPP